MTANLDNFFYKNRDETKDLKTKSVNNIHDFLCLIVNAIILITTLGRRICTDVHIDCSSHNPLKQLTTNNTIKDGELQKKKKSIFDLSAISTQTVPFLLLPKAFRCELPCMGMNPKEAHHLRHARNSINQFQQISTVKQQSNKKKAG